MYDTIKELPLFKGLTDDQLSGILEKTKVEFLNFDDNEIVVDLTMPVTSVTFILNGCLRNIYKFHNYEIRIEEFLVKGNIVGGKHLFGLDTRYGFLSLSKGKTSVMRINKKDYLSILQDNEICLINYLNYLSAVIHRSEKANLYSDNNNFVENIRKLLVPITTQAAKRIEVKGNLNELSKLFGMDIIAKESNMISSDGKWSVEINRTGIIIENKYSR